MKKIYTLVMGLVISALFYSEANAQCANGIAVPFRIIFSDGQVGCVVRISNAPAGTKITAYSDAAGTNIINLNSTSVFVAPDGTATLPIQCDQPVGKVTLLGEDLSTNPHTPLFFDITGTCIAAQQNANLPINLSKFVATIKSSSNVLLSWSSAQEANSSHFDVEKSADGKNFTAIGSVKASGYSNHNVDYSFADTKFGSPAFYRLKMVDIDGKSEYSKVVYVNNGSSATTTLSIFPNPFKSEIQLKGVSASEVNKQNIKVFNVAGKEVGYRINGSNSITLDGGLPQGIYILRVKDQTYKMVKSE